MRNIFRKIKVKIKSHIYLYIIIKNILVHCTYFIDKISNYRLTKKFFFKKLGYHLNFENPKSFNEKVFWKKIYDRNPLLPITADKYEVRSYIKEVLGEKTANEILIPLLYVTDKPDTIPFQNISPPFIIKPNHASGRYIIIENNNNYNHLNKKEIIRTCWGWLKIPYGLDRHEWAYQPIKRKIVIEKLLQDEDGKIPKDYKFFIFHGVCRKIMVFFDRFSEHGSRIISYDRNWKCLSKSNSTKRKIDDEKPETYQKMLDIAEKLGNVFDFVRVDLYTIVGRIYFGELTHYPMSGFNPKASLENDIESGKYWHIERNKFWVGKQTR